MDAPTLDVALFVQRFDPQSLDFYRPILARHTASIKVRRETTALPNLQKIFLQTLALSNSQGFQAMGLRDLSAATGISLGALYSYIDSKDHLLRMILEQVNDGLGQVISEQAAQPLEPRQHLTTLLRALLYTAEALHPWLFFAMMEGHHLPARPEAAASTEALPSCGQIIDGAMIEVLNATRGIGQLRWADTTMAAALIKPLVTEWVLNRETFAARSLPVEHYADAVVAFVEQSLLLGP